MTVTNQSRRTSAVGSGSTGQDVPFPFPIKATSDLTVISRVTSTGVETGLAETTNYTVVIDGDVGGTLTTVTAISSSDEIHIIRNTPMTQPLKLVIGGSFSSEDQEDAFDNNAKLIIENSDALDRSIHIPDTDANLSMELPNSVDRASKVVGFDANGVVNVQDAVPAGSVAFTTYGKTIVNGTDAFATRNLLITGRLNELNALDFSVFPDSVSRTDGLNNTTQFDLMVDEAQANGIRNIYFPTIAGDTLSLYTFLTQPAAATGVFIRGDGQLKTVLKCDFLPAVTTTPFLDFSGASGGIKDIGISAGDLCTQGVAIKFNHNSNGSTMARMRISTINIGSGVWTRGIFLDGSGAALGIRHIQINDVSIFACDDFNLFGDRAIGCSFYNVQAIPAGSTSGLTSKIKFTGDGTKDSGPISFIGGQCTDFSLDFATQIFAVGDFDTITTTGNTTNSIVISNIKTATITNNSGSNDVMTSTLRPSNTAPGLIELADTPETIAGTDSTRAISPATLGKGAINLLGTATVNLQNGDSKSTAFTVPSGFTAVITHVVIRSPTASLAGGTDFDIGSGANADTWRQAINLSTMTTTTTDYMVIPSVAAIPGKFTLEAADAVFGIKPATGATADADATMDVFGYLF